MIRILHVLGRTDKGGVETMIVTLYRVVDKAKIQFDFMDSTGRSLNNIFVERLWRTVKYEYKYPMDIYLENTKLHIAA